MARQANRIVVDVGQDLRKMIAQRAEQEGVSISDYIREAVLFEMVFSGDLEATKFVAKSFGKRVKEALVNRIAGVDVQSQVEVLTKN